MRVMRFECELRYLGVYNRDQGKWTKYENKKSNMFDITSVLQLMIKMQAKAI